MLYIREEIPSKLIQLACRKLDPDNALMTINFRRKKWLLICNYNPHKTLDLGCLEYISKEIDCDSILPLEDFNSEHTQEAITTL